MTIGFEIASKKAAEHLVMRSAEVLAQLLEVEDATSVSDAVRVYEAANKRLGLYQNERQDNLPVIHWNIIGGNVTIEVDRPMPALVLDEVTDVDPLLIAAAAPLETTEGPKVNLDFESVTDDDL